MAKVLVTGGCGHKGLQKVLELLGEGHQVFVFDNLSKEGFGAKNKLPSEAEFIFGDIRDDLMLARVLKDKGIEAIYHYASVKEQHTIESQEINVGGLLKVKKLAAQMGLNLN